jgi:hypothetical protein
MAAMASLLYFLLIRFCLHKIASLQPHRELRFGQRQDDLRRFLELLLLMVPYIRPLALGKPVHEKCLAASTEKDDHAIAFGSSLPGPRNALLDDFSARSASI